MRAKTPELIKRGLSVIGLLERAKKLRRTLGLQAPKPLIILPARREPSDHRRYLAAVAIMLNEGRDLREWLEFHRTRRRRACVPI